MIDIEVTALVCPLNHSPQEGVVGIGPLGFIVPRERTKTRVKWLERELRKTAEKEGFQIYSMETLAVPIGSDFIAQ